MKPESNQRPPKKESFPHSLKNMAQVWENIRPRITNAMPDGSPWPKISVITPSFNQGQFIDETIRSVFLQEYPNIEFIIVDGGSGDNSVEIIKGYESRLAYWISEPDRGQSHAINKGIQRATGEILFWLNSDDLCLPDAFRKAAMAFHANPEVRLITGQALLIDQEGRIIGELRSHFSSWEELATNPGNSIRQVSTFFSTGLFAELGLIDENPNLAMDTELLFRFTRHYPPLILNEYLAAFRTHSAAKTEHLLLKWYEETDRTRAHNLPDKRLLWKYRQRSSNNWLNLSESGKWTEKKRMRCLINAVKNYPAIFFSRNFFSAIKSIFLLKVT